MLRSLSRHRPRLVDYKLQMAPFCYRKWRVTSLPESLAGLATLRDQETWVFDSHVLDILETSLFFGSTTSKLEDLLVLMSLLEDLRLRRPLQEATTYVTKFLSTADPNLVVQSLYFSGRAQVYPPEACEYLADQADRLSSASMALLIYEYGRHGLRCKHLQDKIFEASRRKIPDMTAEDIALSCQGYSRFMRDWHLFYLDCLPRIREDFEAYPTHILILLLRTCRELKNQVAFLEFQGQLATHLQGRQLSDRELGQVLMPLDYSEYYGSQTQGFIQQLRVRLEENPAVIEGWTTIEVTDVLQSLTSWGLLPLGVYQKMGDLLVDRLPEIKYSPNVSLWSAVTVSFSRVKFFHQPWLLEALTLAKDPYVLEKISFFQQCQFLGALSRLNLYDEGVYDQLARTLGGDLVLARDLSHLSPLVSAMAKPRHQTEAGLKFLEAAFERTLEELPKLPSRRLAHKLENAVVQLAWCFGVLGFAEKPGYVQLLIQCLAHKNPRDKTYARRLAQLCDWVGLGLGGLGDNAQVQAGIAPFREMPKAGNWSAGTQEAEPSDETCKEAVLQVWDAQLSNFPPPEVGYQVDARAPFWCDLAWPAQKIGVFMGSGDRRLKTLTGLLHSDFTHTPVLGYWQANAHLHVLTQLLALRGWQVYTMPHEELLANPAEYLGEWARAHLVRTLGA